MVLVTVIQVPKNPKTRADKQRKHCILLTKNALEPSEFQLNSKKRRVKNLFTLNSS